MQGKIEQNGEKSSRRRASTNKYVSPNQLTLCGFESPFEQQLSKNNRWVKLSLLIPWDKIVKEYDNLFSATEGRPPLNGRLVLGSVIIKHFLDLTDRETIAQIEENMFMQYFIGYTSFSNEAPFNHSMFSKIRARLSLELVSRINALILKISPDEEDKIEPQDKEELPCDAVALNNLDGLESVAIVLPTENRGKLLMDATVAPQNITYPTDLKLLQASRKKTEEIIDKLYDKTLFKIKPRTYRQEAQKAFLNTVRKKSKSFAMISAANGQQLNYVRRNLEHIKKMLDTYNLQQIKVPLKEINVAYLETIRKVYEQQNSMYLNNTRRIEHRIVNIHQPHVRPIVRGKEGKKVEFGSKLQVSMTNGFAFIDKLSWDNFNEGNVLKQSVEKYKHRFGCYPKQVLADQIYCNRENRAYLKSLKIELLSKPLGRPAKDKALSNHVSPGERNPIEGKFGQSKVGYGMNNIRAKLKSTSESWVATILLVINLVNLTRLAPLRLYLIEVVCKLCYFDRLKNARV
jgi:transposase, IS5 family